MKHLRRIFVICLAVVMMCTSHVCAAHPFPSEVYPGKYVYYNDYGTFTKVEVYGTVETGIYGTSYNRLAYPITASYFKSINTDSLYGPGHYDYWYDYTYKNFSKEKLLECMSNIWFSNYSSSDPEIWPEEYLNRFEAMLDDHQVVMSSSDNLKYRVESYKWNGKNLTVNCAADYDIKGYNVKTEYDQWLGTIYHITANGDFTVGASIAVTNKSDGKLVYLLKHDSFAIRPDYVCTPGSYSAYVNDCYECPYTPSQLNTSHSGTAIQTLTITLPEFIDTEKHDITLYFYDPKADTEISSLRFMNPHNISTVDTESPDKPEVPVEPEVPDTPEVPSVPKNSGDANGDGRVNAIDITTLSIYLSGADVTVHSDGDYNGDGTINSADLLLLRRKLTGADV